MLTATASFTRGTAILTFGAGVLAAPYLAAGILDLTAAQPLTQMTALALAIVSVALGFLVMRIGAFSRITLADLPLGAAIVVLPPGLAAVVALAARLVVAIVQRHDAALAARAAASSMLSAGTAAVVFRLLDALEPNRTSIPAAFAAALVFAILEQAQIGLLVTILRRRAWHGPVGEWWLTIAGARSFLVVPVAIGAAYAPVEPAVVALLLPFVILISLSVRARFEAERKVRLLDSTILLGRAMGATLDSIEVFRVLHRHVSTLMDTTVFAVAEIARPRGMVRFRFLVTGDTERMPAERPLGEGLIDHVIRTGVPVLLRDEALDRARLRLPTSAHESFGVDTRSAIVVPMRIRNEVIGAISVRSSRRAAYDAGDVELLESFAVVVANAGERADLYQRAAALSRRLVDLHRVGTELSAHREIDPLVRALCGSVVDVIGAAGASVYLDVGEGRLRRAGGNVSSASGQDLGTLYRTSLPGGYALDLTTPLEFPDSALLPADARAILEGAGRRAIIAQPLRAVDEPVGVLFVTWAEPHAVTDEERELIGVLAGIGGSSIRSVRLYRELDDAYVSTVTALTATIEARDHYREDHQRRVAMDVLALGERLGLSEGPLRDLRYAALFHSLGKIGVPPAVLAKEGPLTPQERDLVREHPLLGARVLESIPFLRGVVPIVRHANERWDGSGYPAGLRGNDIPYAARMLQIAISYEAMLADRPYRAALPADAALAELRSLAGVRYDPVLVIEFTRLIESRGAIAATEQAVETTSRELSILAQITPEFHNLLDVQQLLDRILTILARSIPGASLTILLEDEETRELVVRAAAGARRDLAGPDRMAAGRGLSGWVMRNREPVLVDDVRADPRYVGDPSVRAEIVVPLISNVRAIGVLVVSHPAAGAFSQRDLALLQTVGAQIAAAIDVAELHERLKRAANNDALTGIHNYGYFYQRLEEEVARAERRGTPLSVAFFDIDELKRINDTHGHRAGDTVLRTLGRTFEASIRTEDVPARYGGDEFAIVMPDTPRDEAEKVVQRLMDVLDRTPIVLEGGATLEMPGRSWGVASFPLDGRTARELVDNADRRAYARKRSRL